MAALPVMFPVAFPMFGLVKAGEFENTTTPVPVLSVKAPNKLAELKDPKEVVFPTEVIAPVKLALVVTVEAFPVILPEIGFVTVRLDKVPTLVRDELTTLAAKVVPVNVPASATAVIVIFPVPSNDTPLIVRAV